jgi:tartrate-resistant acid phosphatase type 5
MRTTQAMAALLGGAALAVLPFSRADFHGASESPLTPIEALAAKLPPDVGDALRRWSGESKKDLKAMGAFSGPDLEHAVMESLASDPGAGAFVLGKLPAEPVATDINILHIIGVDAFWVDVPGVDAALEALAAATTDDTLMLACLDTDRRLEVKRLRRILTARIAAARAAGDPAALRELALADERWVETERGATLPGFMRKPPALFTVKAADQPVRVVGFGDFGSGTSAQKEVAAEIVRMGQAARFDLGITLGDNFYPSGMRGTDDPRWRDWWENLYGPLGITFYPALGNHEWYSDDGAAAELAYRSATWRFPAPYYTFTAGPVQFFAIDTTEISEAEVLWLDQAIAASTARWKVVYGHHPIFAPERSAKAGTYLSYMQARLWPLLRNRVDAYLCGHQHAMAHMDPRDGVHFFMSGGGGAALGKVDAKAPGTMFAESTFGFLTLEADEAKLRIAIFDTDGKAFASEDVTK